MILIKRRLGTLISDSLHTFQLEFLCRTFLSLWLEVELLFLKNKMILT